MPTSSGAGRTEPAPQRPRTEAEQELVVLHDDAGADGPRDDDRGAGSADGAADAPQPATLMTGTPSTNAPRTATPRTNALRSSTVRPSTTGSIGLLLAGRYRLDERRGRDGDSSAWDGHDTQLERQVLIRVVSGRAVPPALEGARVAAAHHGPGLTRILDTGSARATDGTVLGWVVEERPPGDRLDDLVRDVPLDAARARAVVGQAALALAEAARAGCHHRLLTPSSLYVSGGSAVVSGLVVAAAAAGLEPTSEEGALAEDGRGLASLLYAALSGLWPHDTAGPVGAEPRADGAALPLHVLLLDVPNDLDALVSAALSESGADGPTPQTMADSLLGRGGTRGREPGESAPAAEPEPDDGTWEISLPETQPLSHQARHAPVPAGPDPVFSPVPALSPGPQRGASTVSGGGGQARRGSRRAAREARTALETQGSARGSGQAPRSGDGRQRPVPSAGSTGGPAADTSATEASGPEGSGPDTSGSADSREPRTRLREGVGSLGAAAGAAAGTALTRSGRAVRTAVASSPPPSGPPAGAGRRYPGTAAAGSADGGTGAVPSSGGAVRAEAAGDATSGMPLIEEIAGDEARRGPSHLRGATAAIALAIVAVLLVIIGIVAFRQVPTLQGIGDSLFGGDQRITAPAPSTPSDDPTEEAGTGPTEAAAAPVVTGVRALDPQGDGSENDDRAPDAADGDPSTSWKSENYATAALGNLKEGVGVVLDLEGEAPVSEVDLAVAGSGGQVEVRTSTDGSFEGSTVIAQGPAGGATTLPVDPPVTTSHVIIWFTELPLSSGTFAADLSEVVLR